MPSTFAPTHDPLLDNVEAAKVLGVSPATLGGYRAKGRPAIPFVKIRGRVQYARSDLNKFLAKKVVRIVRNLRPPSEPTALSARPPGRGLGGELNADGSLKWNG